VQPRAGESISKLGGGYGGVGSGMKLTVGTGKEKFVTALSM